MFEDLNWTRLPNGDTYGSFNGLAHYYIQESPYLKEYPFRITRIYPSPAVEIGSENSLKEARRIAQEDFENQAIFKEYRSVT